MRSLALLLLVLCGCAARPVSGFTTIPKDTAATCTSICSSLGLQLGSVVVVASEVGCVCNVPGKTGGAGAMGAAEGAVMAVEHERRQAVQDVVQ